MQSGIIGAVATLVHMPASGNMIVSATRMSLPPPVMTIALISGLAAIAVSSWSGMWPMPPVAIEVPPIAYEGHC